jgi:hypothetical protein
LNFARLFKLLRLDPLTVIKGRQERKRHPANMSGDFYVEDGVCITCLAPEQEAPELLGMHPEGHCSFKKQPSTPEEIERAIEAVRVSCVAGLRYGGNNPEILRRLVANGDKTQCDRLAPE